MKDEMRESVDAAIRQWHQLVEHYVYRIDSLRNVLLQVAKHAHDAPLIAARALKLDDDIADQFNRRVPARQSKPK